MTDPIEFLHRPCSGSAACLYAVANPDGTVTIGDTDPALTGTLTVPRATWDAFVAELRRSPVD